MARVRRETVLQAGGAISPTIDSPGCRTVRAIAAMLSLLFSFAAPAETVRSKADLRLWETAQDRSAPLAWPWEDGADEAVLAFSNRVTRSAVTVAVSRNAGESRGSCALPAKWSTGDALVDVALVQTRGGVEVARESATVAYVSGAGGGPITVRALGTREWKRVAEPRVHAFDPTWLGEVGESGYDIAWPEFIGTKITIF